MRQRSAVWCSSRPLPDPSLDERARWRTGDARAQLERAVQPRLVEVGLPTIAVRALKLDHDWQLGRKRGDPDARSLGEARQPGALAVARLEVERPDTVRGAGFVRVAVAVALRGPARLAAARTTGRDLDAGQEVAEQERIGLEHVVEHAQLIGGE